MVDEKTGVNLYAKLKAQAASESAVYVTHKKKIKQGKLWKPSDK